jgi:hypothetical protein
VVTCVEDRLRQNCRVNRVFGELPGYLLWRYSHAGEFAQSYPNGPQEQGAKREALSRRTKGEIRRSWTSRSVVAVQQL